MARKSLTETLIFEAPIIGPRVYLSKSSSGFLETFDRKKLDAELTAFLAPNTIAAVAQMFTDSREIGESHIDRTTSWFTIRGYLGRIKGMAHHLVPQPVAIAFWAHVNQIKLDQPESN